MTDLPRMVEVTVYKATHSNAQETEAAQQIEELLGAQEICRNVAALRCMLRGQHAGVVGNST